MVRRSLSRRQWLLRAVAGLIAVAAAGYAAWQLVRPTTPMLSEQAVRQFVAAVAREVAHYRGSLAGITSTVEQNATAVAAARASIEVQTSATIEAVEAHAARARQRIEAIEPLSARTRRNRLDRIRRRLHETKKLLAREADAARAALPAAL